NIMESSIFNLMTGEKADTTVVVAEEALPPDTAIIGNEVWAAVTSNNVTSPAVGEELELQEEATPEGRTREFLDMLFQLIDKSLEEAKGGGVFAGVGILLFLYTILLLFNDIE